MQLGSQGKGGTASRAPILHRLGAAFIVAVQPSHHDLRVPAGARGHCARATASRDLVQGQKALAAASVAGTQGQVAQVLPCLAPTFMVNTQHHAKPRAAEKPSYGNRHRRSKHPNYGSQTGRGLDALNMALGQRRPREVIHHSDQGSQYTSLAFGKRCKEAGVRPSMGSVGDAYDNALCESFFATLECELLERRRFASQIEARMACFSFIEGFYNPTRRHSALGYRSPICYEQEMQTDRQSATP